MFLQVTQYNKDLKPELMDPEPQPFPLFHSQVFLLKLSKFIQTPVPPPVFIQAISPCAFPT